MAHEIRLKRAYDEATDDDGARILVERLWPRGVRKEAAALDEWLKDVAPSPELRTWYKHESPKWDEFRERYRRELAERVETRAAVERLADRVRNGPVTLVLATKDVEHSSAALLKEYLEEKLAG